MCGLNGAEWNKNRMGLNDILLLSEDTFIRFSPTWTYLFSLSIFDPRNAPPLEENMISSQLYYTLNKIAPVTEVVFVSVSFAADIENHLETKLNFTERLVKVHRTGQTHYSCGSDKYSTETRQVRL